MRLYRRNNLRRGSFIGYKVYTHSEAIRRETYGGRSPNASACSSDDRNFVQLLNLRVEG